MPKDVKKTPKSSNDEDNTQFDEGKVDRKMEEFLQPKLDQMQRELGEKMMKAVEAQLTAQFANFAKQLGQMGRPAVPSTPLPVKRTPPPPPPLQTSRHVKQEDSHVKKLMFGNPQSPPILQLIQEKYPKESIMQASNSTIQLKSDNGDMFIARFLDYLKTLGIDKAFRATRIKSIDVTTRKEVEVKHLANIKLLEADPSSSNRWHEAHLKLKTLLPPEMYKEFCVNNDKNGDQNFFDLWDQCMKKTGNKQTGETLLFKKQQFEKLSLTAGSVLTAFISQVGATAEDVNSLANSTVISDFEQNMKLLQQARQWNRFQFACQQTLSSIHTMPWREFSEVFEIHKPLGQKGEEIPLSVPDTGIEPDGTKVYAHSELANAVVITCAFCKKKGHTEEKCRSRQYQGFRVPNGECKGWVMTGACHWNENPNNTSKAPCKFNHSPGTRNKKNWQPTRQPATGSQVPPPLPVPAPQASAQAVTTKEEKAELLTMVAKNLLKAKNTTTTEENKPGNGAAFGVTDEELTGILSLVNGMPADWSCHITHNAFDVLQETEENQDQATEPAIDQEPAPTVDQVPHQQEEASVPSPPTGIEPEWWLITFMCMLWRKLSCSQSNKNKKKKKKKKQQAKTEQTLHIQSSKGKGQGAVLLDSACSKSNTPNQSGLTKLVTKFVRMFTADNSSNLSTTEGTMIIEGMPVRVSVCPTFDKTLVSLGELDQQGVTWTGGKGTWTLYDKDGVLWTTLKRGADNLYHFEKAEL
jgi:hypothetical protein